MSSSPLIINDSGLKTQREKQKREKLEIEELIARAKIIIKKQIKENKIGGVEKPIKKNQEKEERKKMALRKFMNYLFMATAALLLLGAVQSPPAEARKFIGVNPFCRTASYRRLCTQMVNGAANWHDASVNAMKSTLELAKRIKNLVPLVKPAIAHLAPISRDSIMETCVENFDDIVDDIEVSLQALEADDIGTVRSHLSAAFTTDCEDALKEFGADFPLSKFARHLTREVDNCLAVLMQN